MFWGCYLLAVGMVQNCEQRGGEESDKRERGQRLMEGGERLKKPVKKRSKKGKKKKRRENKDETGM